MPGKAKANNQVMLTVLAMPDTAAIRTAEFAGEEHTVIPVVMLTEGVLWPANASSPELALAEEFGRWPESWDGRPVVLNHPQVNGVAVSANSPNVLEARAVGQLFNTARDGTKLRSEMWINNIRVKEIGEEAEDTLTRLQQSETVVEVSTGLFVMLEDSPGVKEGKKFSTIWRNCVPDHLAILPEGIKGACSAEAGCGAPRTNATSEDWTSYILKGEGPTINAKGCKCSDPPETAEENKSLFKQLVERFKNIKFKIRDNDANGSTMSDMDIRTALRSAIAKHAQYFWIVAIYNEGNNAGTVVYEDWTTGDTLYAQDFKIDGGKIALADNRTQVRPETRFVPVDVSESAALSTQQAHLTNPLNPPSTSEVINVDKKALVDALLANTALEYKESDREWLTNLTEEQLKKMTPKTNAAPQQVAPAQVQQLQQAAPVVAATPKTAEQYIADAPAEIQSILREGLTLQAARKTQLIDGLLATQRCKFTKEQLQTRDIPELENLAALAAVPDYSGQSAGSQQRQNTGNEAPPAPVAFPVKKAS